MERFPICYIKVAFIGFTFIRLAHKNGCHPQAPVYWNYPSSGLELKVDLPLGTGLLELPVVENHFR